MRVKFENLTDEHKSEIRTIHQEVRDDFRTAEISGIGLTVVRRVLSEPWPDVTLEVVES